MNSSEIEQLWRQQLGQGLLEMGLVLSAEQRQKLLGYLAILNKWNNTYNLTAVRNPQEMVPRHLLDALSILHLIRGKKVLDVGTGPGLPGIPLAIAMPQLQFTLLDSNGKKTRFVQQAKMELQLANVTVVQSRIERFHSDGLFDTITSRAFSSLQNFVHLTLCFLADSGSLVAMKGALPEQEIDAAKDEGLYIVSEQLRVPLSEAVRHAAVVTRAG